MERRETWTVGLATFGLAPLGWTTMVVIFLVIKPLCGILLAMLNSVVAATLYHHLRYTREGATAKALGEVFD
jgi:hypothetical protein